MVYNSNMTNSEWIQPDRSERFAVASLPVEAYRIQAYKTNAETVKATELAIAEIYNGKAGGSVHDKIYIPPIEKSDSWGVGTLFFVIDTYDPRLGINAERPNNELQVETDQTSASDQRNVDELHS